MKKVTEYFILMACLIQISLCCPNMSAKSENLINFTIDDFFIKAKSKIQNKKISSILTFSTVEGKIFNNIETIKSEFCSISDRDNNYLQCLNTPGKNPLFKGNNTKNYWSLIAGEKLVKSLNVVKNVNYPNIIFFRKFDLFKKYFKKISIDNKIHTINGKKCYKLICVVVRSNVTYNLEFFFCRDHFCLIRTIKPFMLKKKVCVNTTNYYYTNTTIPSISWKKSKIKLFKNQKIFLEINTFYKVILPNIPLKKELLLKPKNKDDFIKLKTYFDYLRKKYVPINLKT